MDSSNPKISFIPKGSLVREESFLERRRPQSAIGLLAGIVFILSVASFVGLYYYNSKLNLIVADKKSEIDEVIKKLKNAPEVVEARIFRARVDLANDLLSSHKLVSPVFVFLADNTTESVLYDKFSLKNDSSGAVLELGGEAENYASLAFQSDVLRGKTDELLEFSINNMALTKLGSVSFNATLVFKPDFLLYTKNISKNAVEKTEDTVRSPGSASSVGLTSFEEETAPATMPEAITLPDDALDVATSRDIESEVVGGSLSGGWTQVSQEVATTTQTDIKEESVLRKLWQKFKFW